MRFLQEDNTIDIIVGNDNVPYYELFFGPLLLDAVAYSTHSKNIGEILFELGLVQSKSWCRKNNWWRELQPGYQEISFGSKRVKLCLLIA